jgi:Kae1-associated kinase Bud32
MILRDGERLFFIDFGLGDYSDEVEARGVDLLLMSRAFKSTHFSLYSKAFEAVVEGYRSVAGEDDTQLALKKMREIEKRGRYSERSRENLLSHVKHGEV